MTAWIIGVAVVIGFGALCVGAWEMLHPDKPSQLPPGNYDARWEDPDRGVILVDWKTTEDTVYNKLRRESQIVKYRVYGGMTGRGTEVATWRAGDTRLTFPHHRSTAIATAYAALAIEVEAIPWEAWKRVRARRPLWIEAYTGVLPRDE